MKAIGVQTVVNISGGNFKSEYGNGTGAWLSLPTTGIEAQGAAVAVVKRRAHNTARPIYQFAVVGHRDRRRRQQPVRQHHGDRRGARVCQRVCLHQRQQPKRTSPRAVSRRQLRLCSHFQPAELVQQD